MFGPAIETADATLRIPVMKPNEAMFHAALCQGSRIAMTHISAPADAGMVAEFEALSVDRETRGTLESFLCDGALAAKRNGDVAPQDRPNAARGAALKGYDAILLAQFSMAGAAELLWGRTDIPDLTSPESAVDEMRRRSETDRVLGTAC